MSEKEIYKKVGQFSIVKSGENSASIDNCKKCFTIRMKKNSDPRLNPIHEHGSCIHGGKVIENWMKATWNPVIWSGCQFAQSPGQPD